MDQTHVLDDIPAFALGILEPEEKLKVINHLKVCQTCQAELKAYQKVVGEMAVVLPQMAPPARVKTAILNQIKPQVKRSGIFEQFRAWLLGPGAGLRVAAVALILVLAASNALLWGQVRQINQMQSHGFGSVILQSTNNAPRATGMVVYTTDGKYGFLVVNGLDALQPGQQYQLWLVKGQQRTSGGVFSVEPDGYFVLEVQSKVPLTTYDGFGITIEPAGGSPSPTGKRVLAGSF